MQTQLNQKIEFFKESASRWNHYYSASRAAHLQSSAIPLQLQYYKDLQKTHKEKIKIRLEEPSITVYSNDLNLLYNVVSGVCADRLKEIHVPKNPSQEALLSEGHIITSKAEKYAYKITLREHLFNDVTEKYNILDYLYNLNEEIEAPKGLQRNLGSTLRYFTGGYFYCNDEKIVTFINLICPRLVSGIYKLSKPIL